MDTYRLLPNRIYVFLGRNFKTGKKVGKECRPMTSRSFPSSLDTLGLSLEEALMRWGRGTRAKCMTDFENAMRSEYFIGRMTHLDIL